MSGQAWSIGIDGSVRAAPALDITIGVDIGQKRDPTAIAVTECTGDDDYACRFLERLPLGTPYPAVADRLTEIVRNVERRARTAGTAGGYQRSVAITVYVDATGVGTPVVDLLQAAEVPIIAVYFTHGDRRTDDGEQVTLGKAWLVSRLQALFQTDRLRLPREHPEAAALMRELLDYEIKVSEDANDRYGAFKTGAHDDLVTALGLAVQEDPGDKEFYIF